MRILPVWNRPAAAARRARAGRVRQHERRVARGLHMSFPRRQAVANRVA